MVTPREVERLREKQREQLERAAQSAQAHTGVYMFWCSQTYESRVQQRRVRDVAASRQKERLRKARAAEDWYRARSTSPKSSRAGTADNTPRKGGVGAAPAPAPPAARVPAPPPQPRKTTDATAAAPPAVVKPRPPAAAKPAKPAAKKDTTGTAATKPTKPTKAPAAPVQAVPEVYEPCASVGIEVLPGGGVKILIDLSNRAAATATSVATDDAGATPETADAPAAAASRSASSRSSRSNSSAASSRRSSSHAASTRRSESPASPPRAHEDAPAEEEEAPAAAAVAADAGDAVGQPPEGEGEAAPRAYDSDADDFESDKEEM
jgi:ribonuclease E